MVTVLIVIAYWIVVLNFIAHPNWVVRILGWRRARRHTKDAAPEGPTARVVPSNKPLSHCIRCGTTEPLVRDLCGRCWRPRKFA